MPSRNTVKIYLENAYYHIYNRGIEGKNIFSDDQDHKVFLHFLKRYLTPSDKSTKKEIKESQNQVRPRWKNDIVTKISLISYCLMPNHFHLLVKQFDKDGIAIFIQALMNSYVRYFNEKYKRIGGLFQGRYKAIIVDKEAYLLHLTRYIHLNPLELPGLTINDLTDYYSSYGDFIGRRKSDWVHPEEILSYFGSKLNPYFTSFRSYQRFVEEFPSDGKEILGKLVLE